MQDIHPTKPVLGPDDPFGARAPHRGLSTLIATDKPAFALAVVRFVLGLMLVIKGGYYFRDQVALTNLMIDSNIPLASAGLARVVAVVHVAGGLMLAFGVLARVGAIIQIPNVLGAVIYIHARQLFSSTDAFDFPALVLVLLVLFAWLGSDRWSSDWAFRDHPKKSKTKSKTATDPGA